MPVLGPSPQPAPILPSPAAAEFIPELAVQADADAIALELATALDRLESLAGAVANVQFSEKTSEPLNLEAQLQALWLGITFDARDLLGRLRASTTWTTRQFREKRPASTPASPPRVT